MRALSIEGALYTIHREVFVPEAYPATFIGHRAKNEIPVICYILLKWLNRENQSYLIQLHWSKIEQTQSPYRAISQQVYLTAFFLFVVLFLHEKCCLFQYFAVGEYMASCELEVYNIKHLAVTQLYVVMQSSLSLCFVEIDSIILCIFDVQNLCFTHEEGISTVRSISAKQGEDLTKLDFVIILRNKQQLSTFIITEKYMIFYSIEFITGITPL
ncbi:hypothetical protein ACJX0J_033214, partial [Zea mays]